MTKEDIEVFAKENELEIKYFDDFFDSILGFTLEGNVVYDYDKMIEEYIKNNKCTYEEAVEWIDYNTIRTAPYIGAIIVYGGLYETR